MFKSKFRRFQMFTLPSMAGPITSAIIIDAESVDDYDSISLLVSTAKQAKVYHLFRQGHSRSLLDLESSSAIRTKYPTTCHNPTNPPPGTRTPKSSLPPRST